MNLLQLSHRLPWPPIDGGKKGTLGFVQGYARHPAISKHVLYSICPIEESKWAAEWKPEGTELHVELIDARNRVWPFLKNTLFSDLPFNMDKYRLRSYSQQLRALLSDWAPDVVHFDSLHMACYSSLVREMAPTALQVLRCHNAEHVILERLAENESNPIKQGLIGVQARRLKRYEGTRLGDFDLVLAITDVDADRFNRINGEIAGKMIVVPAGADLPEALPEAPSLSGSDPIRLLHVAAMDWLPNQAGLRWLINTVLPHLDQAGPDYHLDVVGKEMPREFLEMSHPRVTIHGFVRDLRPILKAAHVAVVPLQVGGGMRVKILDYWAQGIPVVSTRVGAEGLQDGGAPVVELADTPDAFAAAIVALASDSSRRDALRRTAFCKVEAGYGWPRIVDGLMRRYQQMISGPVQP